jgi:hypothetical protein
VNSAPVVIDTYSSIAAALEILAGDDHMVEPDILCVGRQTAEEDLPVGRRGADDAERIVMHTGDPSRNCPKTTSSKPCRRCAPWASFML